LQRNKSDRGDASVNEVKAEATVSVPAASAWAAVSDFRGFIEVLGLPVSVIGPDGIGQERVIGHPDGDIVERLESLDEMRMTLTYLMVTPGPMPVADYSARLSVTPAGSSSATITWIARFTAAPGRSDAEGLAAVQGVFDGGLKQIDAHLREH
jgi:hypothetical protein